MRGRRQFWLLFSFSSNFQFRLSHRLLGWKQMKGFYCIQHQVWVLLIGIYSVKGISCHCVKDWTLWLEFALTNWFYWSKTSVLKAGTGSKRHLLFKVFSFGNKILRTLLNFAMWQEICWAESKLQVSNLIIFSESFRGSFYCQCCQWTVFLKDLAK